MIQDQPDLGWRARYDAEKTAELMPGYELPAHLTDPQAAEPVALAPLTAPGQEGEGA